MTCKVVEENGVQAIVCTRSKESKKLKLVNKQGMSFFCLLSKEKFEALSDKSQVTVFEEGKTTSKLFFKEYLKIV